MTKNRQGTTNIEARSVTTAERLLLGRMGRQLRLTDMALATDVDTLSIVENGPAPAWTTLDGDHVSFSLAAMPMPNSPAEVAVWLGTNGHELGHSLFTPRRSSKLIRLLINAQESHLLPGILKVHNVAEDQRQERLLLARFAPWRTYLTAALAYHLRADGPSAWVLFAGRTWLPAEARAQAKALTEAAYGRQLTDAVTRIIGDYQRLVDPGESECTEAFALLEELHDILGSQADSLPNKCQTNRGGGEPDTSEAGEAAPATADEAEAEAEEASGESDGGQADGDGEPSDGDGGDEADGEPGGAGAGSGQAQPESLRKQLTDAVAKDIAKSPDVAEDLASVLDALDHGATDGGGHEDSIGAYREVTDAARRLHHEVGDALLDLKDSSEPGWVKRTDGGRLNVRRLADPFSDADTLFDRYEAGQMDATELELVVLADVSGSMKGRMVQLGETLWAIRQSCDDIEASCTTITWDSGPWRLQAAADQRPDDRMFVPQAIGGTAPATALEEAHRLLAGSQARHRICLTLTDGDWQYSGRTTAEGVVDTLNAAGVITVIGLLGHDAGTSLHHCSFGGPIAEPAQLARLFRTVAVERMGAWR